MRKWDEPVVKRRDSSHDRTSPFRIKSWSSIEGGIHIGHNALMTDHSHSQDREDFPEFA